MAEFNGEDSLDSKNLQQVDTSTNIRCEDIEVNSLSPKFEEGNGSMDQNRNVMEQECQECGEKFDSSTEFSIHFARFHELTRTNCLVCGKQFNTIYSLCLHTGNDHLEETVEYVKKNIL